MMESTTLGLALVVSAITHIYSLLLISILWRKSSRVDSDIVSLVHSQEHAMKLLEGKDPTSWPPLTN